MDIFLNKVSQQAVSFAIRTGIVVTSQFAIKQCGRYISSIKGSDRRELLQLQERLQTKIQIISPAIDLVEIISARGNTSLESALTLTKNLRAEIQSLGQRLEALISTTGSKPASRSPEEVKAVIEDIRNLLRKIEEAVPFISLAVTTSGVHISSSIPQNVSPSRLLQASTLLTAGDTVFGREPFRPAQIGAPFTLSLYMLFSSHTHRQEHVSAQDLTWKEVINKCRVKLQRVPLFYDDDPIHSAMRAQHRAEEFCYELCLIEDLDDGRVHDDDAPNETYEDVRHAGIKARIPVNQISKMFYTTSGKLLGIEESSSPILLIKRDKNATPPRRLVDRVQSYVYDDDEASVHEEEPSPLPVAAPAENTDELPAHLDQEWLAFEIYTEPSPDDSDSDSDASDATMPTEQMNSLSVSSKDKSASLSILESLLRLSILQNYQQTSHLAVHDELLHLFLSDAAWGGSNAQRRLERENAANKIGFDPFPATPPGKQRRRSGGVRRDSGIGNSVVKAPDDVKKLEWQEKSESPLANRER